MAKHYINEVGTDLLFDTGVLMATTDALQLWYKKPGDVIGSWSGSLYSSYSILAAAVGNYYIKYTTAVTSGTYDLDVSGDWKLQAYIADTAGTWWGETADLKIYNRFE